MRIVDSFGRMKIILVLGMLFSLPAQAQDASLARAQQIRIEIMQYWKNYDRKSTDALYHEMSVLAAASPRNIDLARIQEAMASGTAIMYAGLRDLPKAEAMYKEIDAIRKRFPDNEHMAWVQAQTAQVLSTSFDRSGQYEKEARMKNDVKDLSNKWPTNEGITLIRERVVTPH